MALAAAERTFLRAADLLVIHLAVIHSPVIHSRCVLRELSAAQVLVMGPVFTVDPEISSTIDMASADDVVIIRFIPMLDIIPTAITAGITTVFILTMELGIRIRMRLIRGLRILTVRPRIADCIAMCSR